MRIASPLPPPVPLPVSRSSWGSGGLSHPGFPRQSFPPNMARGQAPINLQAPPTPAPPPFPTPPPEDQARASLLDVVHFLGRGGIKKSVRCGGAFCVCVCGRGWVGGFPRIPHLFRAWTLPITPCAHAIQAAAERMQKMAAYVNRNGADFERMMLTKEQVDCVSLWSMQ